MTIRYRNGAFSGRVTSTVAGCVARRQVRLMQRTASGNEPVTGVPTDDRGRWIVFADRGTTGSFFAVVMASDDGCDRDRSRTIHV